MRLMTCLVLNDHDADGMDASQVEDAILSHVYALLKPITDALDGSVALQPVPRASLLPVVDDNWWTHFRQAVQVAMQQKVFIEELVLSDVQLTVTARVTIPVLNSFDGTPLRFGVSRMRNVFTFPDQLLKDLAADYVADAIVRSPMLIMSLNILGNPAYDLLFLLLARFVCVTMI